MSEYSVQIAELLSTPDNIEIIRDQLGAILAIELQHQRALALEAEDANAADYDVSVYIENDDPMQYVDGTVNPFPLINIQLDKTETASAASVGKQNMVASFFVDVYATGNTTSVENKGMRASLKAWKVARLIRNILRTEQNSYLHLRGIVGKVRLGQYQSGTPGDNEAAIRVRMIRIMLTVEYVENVPYVDGEDGVEIFACLTDSNGHVLIDM